MIGTTVQPPRAAGQRQERRCEFLRACYSPVQRSAAGSDLGSWIIHVKNKMQHPSALLQRVSFLYTSLLHVPRHSSSLSLLCEVGVFAFAAAGLISGSFADRSCWFRAGSSCCLKLFHFASRSGTALVSSGTAAAAWDVGATSAS